MVLEHGFQFQKRCRGTSDRLTKWKVSKYPGQGAPEKLLGFEPLKRDADLLHGSQTYCKLHPPPNPPARALLGRNSCCNITDGTMTVASQLKPSINRMNEVAKNVDGSVDVYLGPAIAWLNAPEVKLDPT